MKTNKKGFSLVELIIVIAVIAILAAVLIPTFSNMIKKANESAVLQAARSAYEETLAMDLADGKVEGVDDDEIAYATSGTGIYEITVNGDKTNYSTFVYKDDSKKLQATFNGSTWTVSEINPAANQ